MITTWLLITLSMFFGGGVIFTLNDSIFETLYPTWRTMIPGWTCVLGFIGLFMLLMISVAMRFM